MSEYNVKPSGCSKVGGYLFIVFLVVGIVAGIWAQQRTAAIYSEAIRNLPTATPTQTTREIRQRAITVTYDNLARNTESYGGQTIQVRGTVIQVVEGSWDTTVTLLVRVEDGNIVLVRYKGARVLDNDVIDLYARVEGRTSYTTVLGAKLTVPELTALFLEIQN